MSAEFHHSWRPGRNPRTSASCKAVCADFVRIRRQEFSEHNAFTYEVCLINQVAVHCCILLVSIRTNLQHSRIRRDIRFNQADKLYKCKVQSDVIQTARQCVSQPHRRHQGRRSYCTNLFNLPCNSAALDVDTIAVEYLFVFCDGVRFFLYVGYMCRSSFIRQAQRSARSHFDTDCGGLNCHLGRIHLLFHERQPPIVTCLRAATYGSTTIDMGR